MFKVCRHSLIFVNFLEDYNRYEVDIFRVDNVSNELSNDISHSVLYQNL